ncbi:MAG: site-specific integrase [Acidobacteria bacterium]|nr:site-specific integrase [Acidobacteriota bacterium]MCI0622441.1 site-specific integrase [Acidobacteriota bacterium]MCI0722359.1 site-specific integrase [Acidobacteriota bacterium]
MAKPHIRTLSENNVRTGFFEKEHFTAIHRHLPAHVKPVATVAYITGWRTLSELLPLEWRQVDFNGAGTLRLDPGTTKNGDGRVFPMTRDLRAVLLEQKAMTEELQKKLGVLIPWVFHNDGKPFKSYRKAWKTACRNACLPGRIPHDFRRTAVRNLIRAGVSEVVAMKMTGHKTRSIFDRYDIVSQGDLNDAVSKHETFMVTKIVTIDDSSNQNIAQVVEA